MKACILPVPFHSSTSGQITQFAQRGHFAFGQTFDVTTQSAQIMQRGFGVNACHTGLALQAPSTGTAWRATTASR